MRIIGGHKRGMKLQTPDGVTTRPTSDRGRESLMNIIMNSPRLCKYIIGGHVADVFAGTGAIGLEMLSRGADHCVFYEQNRTALNALHTNIKRFNTNTCTVKTNALNPTSTDCNKGQYDCVFLDAPYTHTTLTSTAIDLFVKIGLITKNTLIIVQIAKNDTSPNIPNFTCIKDRKISGGHIYFYC